MTVPRRPPIDLPPAPPSVPRPLTPAVRRRSLLEPSVRFWWLAGLFLAGAALYFLSSETMVWLQARRLVQHGSPVTATITGLGQGEQQGRANFPPDTPVTLEFDFNGAHHSVFGPLDGRTETVSLKQSVPIRVDPANPEDWTYRSDTPPFGPVLFSPALVAPFAIAAGVVSFLLRRRLLLTWKTGVAVPFIIESTGQSALAPASWAVRCRIMDGSSPRLVAVSIPRRLLNPKKGDVLWLIHPPHKPTAAIPAMAYA